MKRVVYISLAVLAFVHSLQAADPYLVKNGKTDFKIVLSDSPQPVERTAAKELKTHLDEITNINWVIVSEKDVPENAPQILVGNSPRARKFFPEINPAQIPYDGIEIHLTGNKLLLTGHKQRGTLYAVNTFLEDILGIRWWTSSERIVPTYKSFQLKPLNISYAPKLIYREAYYKDACDNAVFTTRLKCNGALTVQIPPEYGDHHHFADFVHSFNRLIPPEKYFADHPEWFSEIDGVRKHEHTQLCLTNDEMRKELTKNAIECLRKNPTAKFISISQNDNPIPCSCEKCNKVVEEEGSQSGPLIRFVNAVAEDIEKEFPDVFVETLAYQYTVNPPKYVKPRKNVIIRYCTGDVSFIQPMTGEQNKTFCNDMEGWSKIAPQFLVWDYVTNFSSYILPHPNLRVLAPNIRFFVDHGTIGLFEQGDSWCSVGDFDEMRNWVITKLMWNPTLDEKKLTREFLEGYYGKKATPFLMEYFDVLIDKAELSGEYIRCYCLNTNAWLDYETLCKATGLFDAAVAAAIKESGKDSEFVRRLRRERLPLEHVWLDGYYRFKRYAEKNDIPFLGPVNPEEVCKNFIATCEKYQVTAHKEGATPERFSNYLANLSRRFEKPAPLPNDFKNLDADIWLDIQEFSFQPIEPYWSYLSYVEDPAASNGHSVVIQGERSVIIPINTDEPLFENADVGTKFKVVVYARCDATVNVGVAMTCGVYDQKEGKDIVLKNIDVLTIAGSEYQKIEFEPMPLNQSMYIWFSPSGRKRGEVQGIYVDRVLIIKDK